MDGNGTRRDESPYMSWTTPPFHSRLDDLVGRTGTPRQPRPITQGCDRDGRMEGRECSLHLHGSTDRHIKDETANEPRSRQAPPKRARYFPSRKPPPPPAFFSFIFFLRLDYIGLLLPLHHAAARELTKPHPPPRRKTTAPHLRTGGARRSCGWRRDEPAPRRRPVGDARGAAPANPDPAPDCAQAQRITQSPPTPRAGRRPVTRSLTLHPCVRPCVAGLWFFLFLPSTIYGGDLARVDAHVRCTGACICCHADSLSLSIQVSGWLLLMLPYPPPRSMRIHYSASFAPPPVAPHPTRIAPGSLPARASAW